MKKNKPEDENKKYFSNVERFDSNVENFKRCHSLPPLASWDMGSKLFFDRILSVKKNRDFVFITQAEMKDR